MFALVCGEASGKSRDEVVISTITRGLLNGPEAKAIMAASGGHCNVPLVWIQQAYRKMLEREELCAPPRDIPPRMGRVEACCIGMRAGIGTILGGTSGWGHAPLPFVHLISGMIKLQFLLLAIKEATAIGGWVGARQRRHHHHCRGRCHRHHHHHHHHHRRRRRHLTAYLIEVEGLSPAGPDGFHWPVGQLMISAIEMLLTPIIFQALLETIAQMRNPFGYVCGRYVRFRPVHGAVGSRRTSNTPTPTSLIHTIACLVSRPRTLQRRLGGLPRAELACGLGGGAYHLFAYAARRRRLEGRSRALRAQP